MFDYKSHYLNKNLITELLGLSGFRNGGSGGILLLSKNRSKILKKRRDLNFRSCCFERRRRPVPDVRQDVFDVP